MINMQYLCYFRYPAIDLVLRSSAHLWFKRKLEVFPNRIVRVERVVLKDECHVPVCRVKGVYVYIVDEDIAFVLLFQTSNASQGRGFSCPGRSEQNKKLPGANLEFEIVDCRQLSESLRYALEFYICHNEPPPLRQENCVAAHFIEKMHLFLI